MTRQYDCKAEQTLEIIHSLIQDGISRISVLIRHSIRHFTKDDAMEPFMRLTKEGRDISFNFGRSLKVDFPVFLYSSFIGRCIETAYLIDKGYTHKTGRLLPHTRNEDLLAPFYVNNIESVVEALGNGGDHAFLRKWFDKKLSTKIIEDPEETANRISRFMISRLNAEPDSSLTLCLSHDWNLFPVKEFKLGTPFETAGDIGYLEGIFYFKRKNEYFVMGIDGRPVPITENT